MKPVRFDLRPQVRSVRVAILYSDAFLTVHQSRHAVSRWLQASLPLQALQHSTNGFGSVFLAPGFRPVGFRGQVPLSVLARSCASKAFIFWLEAIAQVISTVIVVRHVCSHVVCFVDNSAAEHALVKGYTKDPVLSAFIGQFWVWAAEAQISISFHRVSSAENLSDAISRGELSELQQMQGQFKEVSFVNTGRVRKGRSGPRGVVCIDGRGPVEPGRFGRARRWVSGATRWVKFAPVRLERKTLCLYGTFRRSSEARHFSRTLQPRGRGTKEWPVRMHLPC